jgi:molecular chaperone DnaJ
MAWRTDTDHLRDPNDPESHKNEGFLKSLWHTLTNNPAHAKANEDANESDNTSKKSDENEKK